MYCEDIENNFLLKFALHFSLNKLNPLDIDKTNLEKNLLEASKKLKTKRNEKTQIDISRKVNSFFALMIFSKNRLIFANEKAQKLFNVKKLNDIENIINNNEDIYTLIRQDTDNKKEVYMQNSDGEDWSYSFFIDIFEGSDDKLLTIVPQHRVETSEAFLSTINRFKFVEKLKDRLVQNSVDQIPMSLICINICNYQKLIDASGSILVHDFLKSLLKSCVFIKILVKIYHSGILIFSFFSRRQ